MLTIAIQAGGESRRMGKDKALLPFLGQPLIQRVIERARPLADEILVTTNQPKDYQFLKERLVTDVIPGRGALGGLYTALSAASHPLVAVIACDMPFINAELLAAERDLMIKLQADVVIPQTENGMEPFHAFYRKGNCLPYIQDALSNAKWRVDSWFHRARLYHMSAEQISLYDPQMLSFRNINTPQELQDALQIAANMDQGGQSTGAGN